MPEVTEQPAKPLRTWRPMALWTAAILLALGLAWFAAAVVVLPRVLLPRNEKSVQETLKQYAEAQYLYRKKQGAYADERPKLQGLLPNEVIAAWGARGKPYRGYLFGEMKTIGGQPIEWTLDFAISAIPVRYGRTGRRSFIMMTNGTTFGHDWGKQVEFFEDYPADDQSPWLDGRRTYEIHE